MRTQLIGGGSILLTALLASTASAQNVSRIAPIPGAVKDAGVYHVATGKWTRAQSTYGILAADTIYRNDSPSGYFGLLDQSELGYEVGRLPGAGNPLGNGSADTGSADAYTVNGFQFGYCALGTGATSYTVTWSDKYIPCGNPGAEFTEIAGLTATGLPNGGCWIVAFDLAGTTQEFNLNAEAGDGYDGPGQEDEDSFGYSLNVNNGQGDGTGQVQAGPILAGTSATADWGVGTVWDSATPNTPGAGSGINTQDLFWLTSPIVADGCYFFGGCLPCASYDMVFFGADSGGGGLTPYCDPANANSVSAGGAGLSGASLGGSSESFTLTDIPTQPGILYSGPNQIQLPFGCGDRCVGGSGVIRYGPFFPAATTDTFTIDMTGDSNGNIQYWYRDPANTTACGASFNLSNALGQ